ncbi:MAG: FtsX-like permease family protein, partial [bacterium]|nr:FtsX-like permease family protein [bacterium]
PEVNQSRTLQVIRVSLLDDDDSSRFAAAMPSYDLLDRHLRDLPGAETASISSVFWKEVSYIDGQRVDLFLKYTDAEFWEILRFDFVEGRPFTYDEVADGSFVAVINEATKERFFGREDAVGRMISSDGKRYRVVGVVKNVPMLRFIPFSDIWVPQTTATDYRKNNELLGLYFGLILAESRDRFPEIREEFASRMASIDLSSQGDWDQIVALPETTFDALARVILSLGKSTESQTARLMGWLVVLAVLFMVLPTVNLVNLNMSRIMERASEIGVRKAFGAPSLTLVGQFVVENVVLTLVGGVFSVVLSFLALGVIAKFGWIPYAQFHLNLRILGYGLAAALFFGLMSGVYPAWRMSRMHPVEALGGGRS